jgi:hypothetical protein
MTGIQNEVDAHIRHVADLVFVRNLLAERGASPSELAECDAEIERQRDELAGVVLAQASELAAAA